jgi:hypothetical protein
MLAGPFFVLKIAWFCMTFRIAFYVSLKDAIGILMKIALDPYIAWEVWTF